MPFHDLHKPESQRWFFDTNSGQVNSEQDEKFAAKSENHFSSSFKHADLSIQQVQQKGDLKSKPDWAKCLKFGTQFSDHMLQIQWSAENGWEKPKIVPFRNLSIHPAAPALHYAIEVFEGLKAHTGVDGKIRLFRPEMHMARMLSSCRRVCLPEFDAEEFLKCIVKLVRVDRAWVPNVPGCSLYVRPTMISTEATLDPRRAREALLYVIAGPVGSYFSSGFRPVSLYADPQLVRSWPGGAGPYKMGSNYAPTLLPSVLAKEEHGCDQVLWLFGPDHCLTEVGTMNIFVHWKNEGGENVLVTPPADSQLILAGVTRASVLELAREWMEFKVEEKHIKMNEIIEALKENRIMEIFGTGTACVVCPVGKILYKRNDGKIEAYSIPTMEDHGEPRIFGKLWDHITGVQRGTIQRPEWIKEI